MRDVINYLKAIRDVTYSQGGVDCLTKAIEKCEKTENVLVAEDTVIIYLDGVLYEIINSPRCQKCGANLKTGDNYCSTCGVGLIWRDTNEGNV